MKNIFNFFKSPKTIIITIIAVLFTCFIWNLGLKDLLDNVEMMTYDWRARLATDQGFFNKKFEKADSDIVIVTADNSTFETINDHKELGIGRWPWPREAWTDVINFIAEGNPKAIVFDIKFEGDEKTDKNFAKVLKKNKNIIFGIALSSPKRTYKEDIDKLIAKYNIDHDKIDSIIYEVMGDQSKPIHKKLSIPVNDEYFKGLKPDDKFKKAFLNNTTFYKHSAIPEIFLDNISSLGVINIDAENEAKNRYNVPVYKINKGKYSSYIPSLPLAAVLNVIPKDEKKEIKIEKNQITFGNRIIPVNNNGKALINWHGKGQTYKYISIGDLLISNALNKKIIDIEKSKKLINPDLFRDKIVVIGQTSAGTDILPTPMEINYPGPEIIATTIDNYLNDADSTNLKRRKFITKAHPFINLLIMLFFCSIIGTVNIKAKNQYLSGLIFLFMIFLFFIFSVGLFVHPQLRIWINITYPMIFIILTAIGTYLTRVIIEDRDRKAVENLFGKFVSPQVLDQILENPDEVIEGNKRKEMSVLFSDIRGFTTMSEKIPADEFIPQINEYFNEMVEIILKNGGTIDKFMGDAVMAFYGDPLPMKDHAYKAVKTSLEMIEKVKELNIKWEKEGKPAFDIGAGINSGEMLVGYMGSHKIMDYTVIGDNVNLGSRIESLNKNYKTNILISEYTYESIKEQIEAKYLDEVKVKGKDIAVKIYEVTGLKKV